MRCNSVNPGVTITNLHKRGGMDSQSYAKFLEHSKTTHAIGRPGLATEIADAIAFLASEQASFITGANLPVDGNLYINIFARNLIASLFPRWTSRNVSKINDQNDDNDLYVRFKEDK